MHGVRGLPDQLTWRCAAVQVWQDEGNDTLWDVLQKRDFPYNLEPLLLGRTLDIAKSHRRRLITIRLILRQVWAAWAAWPCVAIQQES